MENISELSFHSIVSVEIITLLLFPYLVFQIFFAYQFLEKLCIPKTFLEWYLRDCRKLFPGIKHFSFKKVIKSALLSGTWGQDQG